jgi:hypothetical protein
VPITIGQPDQGFEGYRFVGYNVPLRITHPIKLAVEHRVIIVLEYLGTRLCRRLIWMLTLWHHLSAVGASD